MNTPMEHNESNNAPEAQPTAQPTAEQLEIARLQNETAKTEKEILQAKEERSETLRKQALRDGLAASGIMFYEPALVDSALLGEFDIRVSDEGEVTALVNGKRTTKLERVYEAIASKHPTLADGRTTRSLQTTETAPPQRSKSEMTLHEKIAFIQKYSVEEFEKLPMRPAKVVEIRTIEDFSGLPQEKKLEIIAKHGSDFVSNLPTRRRLGIA